MNIIVSILVDELDRSIRMLQNIEKQLNVLHPHSTFIRTVNDKNYLYEVYRFNGKVTTKYLRTVETSEIEEINDKRKLRLDLKKQVTLLHREIHELSKTIERYERKSKK